MKKRGEGFIHNSKFVKSKRAQVTIFIILGIIIVAVGALIYFLYPQIKSTFLTPATPESFIQTCMGDTLSQAIENISMQGGSISPQNYYSYYNPDMKQLYKVEYLCYTNQYYLNCKIQQPTLMSHVESEILSDIQTSATSCFNTLQSNYKSQGYTVNLINGNTTISILPKKVIVTFNNQLTLTKGNTQRFNQFSVLVNNNLYELIAVAYNIVNWEATYGDTSIQQFMYYYRDLAVQQLEQTDGTKIYELKNLNTGDMFQFAVRSIVWPAGYGTNGVI
jgi:hypothetical protein